MIYAQMKHKFKLMDAKGVSRDKTSLLNPDNYIQRIIIHFGNIFEYLSIIIFWFYDFVVRLPTVFRLERCGNESCRFGEICHQDTSVHGSSRLHCTCEGICKNEDANTGTPVCGSDDKTYKSECALLKSSCHQQKHIMISSYKSCNGRN